MKPIRMSREQASLLFANQKGEEQKAKRVRGPRPKRKKEELPENIVEQQIKDFLFSRGFVSIRNHVGTFIPTGVIVRLIQSDVPLSKEQLFRCIIRIGHKGELDWRSVRRLNLRGYMGAVQEIIWEAKAPGEKPTPEQAKELADLQALGVCAEWFDDFNDFPGPHSFFGWFQERFP